MRHFVVDVAMPEPAYINASSSTLFLLIGGAHRVLVDRLVRNVSSMDTYLYTCLCLSHICTCSCRSFCADTNDVCFGLGLGQSTDTCTCTKTLTNFTFVCSLCISSNWTRRQQRYPQDLVDCMSTGLVLWRCLSRMLSSSVPEHLAREHQRRVFCKRASFCHMPVITSEGTHLNGKCDHINVRAR
jgi:hypothetical protein